MLFLKFLPNRWDPFLEVDVGRDEYREVVATQVLAQADGGQMSNVGQHEGEVNSG